MYVVDSYKNLLNEIEISRIRVEGLEEERKTIVKSLMKSGPKDINSISYDGMPKGSSSHMSLDRIVEHVNRIDNMLFIEGEILKNNLKVKNEIKKRIDALEGIEYKIIYMKEIEGKSLKDIAADIKYNYDYVRRVYAKYKSHNEVTDKQKKV